MSGRLRELVDSRVIGVGRGAMAQKVVLSAIAYKVNEACDHRDPRFGTAWMSKRYLADLLGMSRSGVQRAIQLLEAAGLLLESSSDARRGNETMSYRLNEAAIEVLPLTGYEADRLKLKGSESLPSRVATRYPKGSDSLPNTELKGEIEKKNTPSPPSGAGLCDGFEVWWKVYPKHVGKSAAKTAYARAVKKLGSDSAAVATLLEKLEAHVALWRKHTEFPRYVPHPTTWLNQGRWEDEVEPAMPARRLAARASCNWCGEWYSDPPTEYCQTPDEHGPEYPCGKTTHLHGFV